MKRKPKRFRRDTITLRLLRDLRRVLDPHNERCETTSHYVSVYERDAEALCQRISKAIAREQGKAVQ